MTEETARQALFDLHFKYIINPPKKRLELYDEYQKKRGEIRKELVKFIKERKENEIK